MLNRWIPLFCVISVLLFSAPAFSDVTFEGTITTDEASDFKGRIEAPTPHRSQTLRFQYLGNDVDIDLDKIKSITRQAKDEYVIEVISGRTFIVSPQNGNIYNTFNGSLILHAELGRIYIKPERIKKITINHGSK